MNQLDSFKAVCRKYLVLDNDEYIDIIFGTYFANFLDSSPVWLYLIGPPGGGKTEVVQSLRGFFDTNDKYVPEDSQHIVLRDTLTIHSLLSGYVPKDKKDAGKDMSLMPILDNKVLIIKDFTLMLQMRRETLHEILGQLRAVYDGFFDRQTGTKGHMSSDAKFGIIAAVTSEIDHHTQLLTALGERFLSYRLPNITEFEGKKRGMKATDGHLSSIQKLHLCHAAQKMLSLDPVIPTITTSQRRQVVNMAAIIVKARTVVRRDTKTKEAEIPEIEVPTRLSIQLVNLACGIAMARGKNKVGPDEIRLAQETALCSIAPKRLKLFKAMLQHGDVSSANLAEELRFSSSTIDIWLDDLWLLNLVKRKTVIKTIEGRTITAHVWRLTDERLLKKTLFSSKPPFSA